MVAVNQITVEETVWRYRTEGVEKTKSDVDKLGTSLDKLSGSETKSADAQAKSAASSEKAAQAKARYEERVARAQRQLELEARAIEMARAAQDASAGSLQGLADAQLRMAQAATQAAAQQQRAVNDNVASLEKEGSAFREAGKFALEHPVLVLAGSALASRSLAGLATTAGASLGAASIATARFAAGSAEMGAVVTTGAALAAQGLGLASAAASTAAGGFTAYAESVSGLTTTTSLLTRGLTLVPPAIVPIAAAFVAFAVGAAVLEKAQADLARLVEVGERAEKLDVGATFLKSFTDLGPAIRVSADEMQSALQRASTFVQDRLGQQNQLAKAFSDLQAGGYTGGTSLAATKQLEAARNTEERIRAALAGMAELEARGQRLAALDLADKILGPAFAERLRTGQTTITQIVADLDKAQEKQLFTDLDAKRAVELSRAIEDTKRGIDDALKATFDFSKAAMTLNGYWLSVLKTVRDVAEAGNRAVDAVSKSKPTDFERLRAQIDAKQQELARLEASNAGAGYQGDDLKTASVRQEVDRLTAAYENLTRAQAPILDARIDQAIGAAAPPARLMSDELAAMAQAADQAARNLDGTASSAGNAGAALAGAAVKARDFAEALRSIQAANPNLAGTLSLVDRIGKINRDAVEGSKGVLDKFNAGTIGDGEAQTQIKKLNDEAAASIKALRTEADKPFSGYVREAEISKLDDLGQSLARAGDRYGDLRQKALDAYKVEAEAATTDAGRAEAEKRKIERLTQLDGAYKQVQASARKAAADRAASSAGAPEGSDAYDNAIQRTKDQIQEFNLQGSAAGKASEEVYKLTEANRLRRAAASAGRSDEAGIAEAIDAQATAYARARKASEDAIEAQRRLQEGQRAIAQDFSQFAEDILLGGSKIGEALTSLSKSFSSSALKALISGEGPMAGILGTAPTDKGQIGGLLGGKINLGGLLDTDKITESLGLGAETGIGKALSEALKPSKAGGGVLSSPLGGGLVAAGTGASVGYSSQSPLAGAAAGALAGLASGNPYMAVVGAGAGLLGGLLGESDAKKQAKKKLQEEIQARKEALEQARPQIEAMDIQFTGGSIGNVGKSLSDALAQMKAAAKTASDAGDRALADKLVRDYQTYVARMTAVYADGFEGMLAEVQAGFGTNGPFAQAMASVQSFGESLKAFVADSGRLGDPAAAARAQAAAVEGALSQIDTPKTLSATQTELARINGTAAGLTQVLKDLGLSADQAATAIADRTNKALDALRDKFADDLGRKINDAQNKGYLNDAADLIKEVAGLSADANAIGGDLGQVQTYFQAAAQKIVDSSSLTGDAFSGLIQQFPELNGLVHEFSESLTDTASSLDAIAARQSGFQDRTFAAGNDSSTLEGSLAAYDRKAMQERAAEVKAGGQALVDLEGAQAAERVQIITDFATKAADALNARLKGYGDRYFAATNDTSTLGGQLAAYDRQAQQEREDEIKAGGDAIVQLEQTQAAERLKIVTDFYKQQADAVEQQIQAAQTAFDAFAKNIKTFVDNMRAGSSSPLAPKDRLAQAQSQYDAQLALAQGGDRTALDSITTYAQNLLDASKAYNASNSAFQATFEKVAAQLTALPTQVSAEQFIVNAITDSKTALVAATQAMQAALLAGIQSNSPNLVAAALNANFSRLDTSVNGLLDYNEFLAGVGPLATTAEQQAARSIFNQIDANGDGQISQMEAANASSYRVEGYTNSTAANISQSNQILNNQNAILNAQNALASQQSQLLASINQLSDSSLGTQQQIASLNSFIQNNTGYTNDLLLRQFNTLASLYDINNLSLANLRAANGRNGAAVYAEGGWVSGPGTGTSDSIAARLSNGEFVVTAAAARLNGPLLEAMNYNRGFAMPAVAMPMPVAGAAPAQDDRETVALLREQIDLQREEIAVLRKIVETTAAGARFVGGKVDDHAAETRKGNTDRRQDANRPRAAGTRAAS